MYTACHIVLTVLAVAFVRSQQVPWTGPFADNQPGQLVADTAEVAEAKRQHFTAFARVKALLPELPLEQQFPNNIVHNPTPLPTSAPIFIPHQFPSQPQEVQRTWTQYAEEIPRSELGEVPEVALARKNHLKAVMEARALLPALQTEDYSSTVVPTFVHHHVPQSTPPYWLNNNNNNFPQDTPEVAAAKLEHARLFAAAGR